MNKPDDNANDNWAHRSVGMQCRTCMWFVPKANSQLGRCRRHSPVAAGHGWPAVFRTDWCGDHKLSESAFDAPKEPQP